MIPGEPNDAWYLHDADWDNQQHSLITYRAITYCEGTTFERTEFTKSQTHPNSVYQTSKRIVRYTKNCILLGTNDDEHSSYAFSKCGLPTSRSTICHYSILQQFPSNCSIRARDRYRGGIEPVTGESTYSWQSTELFWIRVHLDLFRWSPLYNSCGKIGVGAREKMVIPLNRVRVITVLRPFSPIIRDRGCAAWGHTSSFILPLGIQSQAIPNSIQSVGVTYSRPTRLSLKLRNCYVQLDSTAHKSYKIVDWQRISTITGLTRIAGDWHGLLLIQPNSARVSHDRPIPLIWTETANTLEKNC